VRYNYGLIGCGGAGTNRHLPAADANPRISVRGVCDLDTNRADAAAANVNATAYTDAATMIESEELDAVSIATPPPTHPGVVDDIRAYDVRVLVEKPFATTLEDAEGMLDRKQTITEVNNQLFKPVVRRAVAAVKRGDIGSVKHVYTHSSIPDIHHFLSSHPDWIPSLDAGVFGENLPHWIYLTRAFLGDANVEGVHTSADIDHPEVDFDEVVVQLAGTETKGEIRMTVNSTKSNFVTVVGDDGTVMMDLDNRVARIAENPDATADILLGNVSAAASTAVQTLTRAADHGISMALRKSPVDNSTVVADRAYHTDGHYRQLTELVSREWDSLTVTREDVRNNADIYETVVDAIAEARQEND